MLPLVEVIRGLDTSDETAAAIVALARDLGKTPAEARDFPGFVSNRILMPFINEAAYAVLEGVAEPEAIDTIAKLGFAHPMGPLALADLIGLDTCVAIMEVLQRGLGDPKYAPCPLLRQYVQAGRLGRKTRSRLLRVQQPVRGTNPHSPGCRKAGRGMKILLVDDEPALRELLRVTFEGADVTVDEAGSALEAEARIRTARPDLIVLDLRMPGVGGADLCARLKGSPDTREIPIVLLTGADLEEARRGQDAGAEALVRKPFSPLELLAVVDRLTRNGTRTPTCVRVPLRRRVTRSCCSTRATSATCSPSNGGSAHCSRARTSRP